MKKTDGTCCFLKGCYHVVERCCGFHSNGGSLGVSRSLVSAHWVRQPVREERGAVRKSWRR